MASIFAIISKAVFEADAPNAVLGEVLPLAKYTSKNKALDALAEGGSLFLVTVRPPDERLWLVAILERPKPGKDGWTAANNATPITDITRLTGKLLFESNSGLVWKPGALGMTLQSPRRLTDGDVAVLRGAALTRTGEVTALSLSRVAATELDRTEVAPVMLRAQEKPFAKARKPKPAPKRAPSAPAPVPKAPREATRPAGLAEVTADLEAGRTLSALERALALWRERPSVELAELVEAIGAAVDCSTTPLAGKDHDVHGDWLAVASQRRAVDVGRLMARLPDGTLAMLTKRFQLLASFQPDPRIPLAPLELIATYTSYGAEPAYTAALALAVKMGDGRAAKLIGKLMSKAAGFKISGEQGEKRLRKAEKARAQIAAPPELLAEQLRPLMAAQHAVTELAGRAPSDAALVSTAPPPPVTSARGDDLLAAVLAAPDDDAPRAVYADWLQERNDPRGEFITLQLAGTDNKRTRELLKQHAADWTRPLDMVLRPDTIHFARGFLDSCVVEAMTPAQKRDLVGDPRWATVREIDCEDQDLLVHPVMRAMRRATLDGDGASRLAAADRDVPLEAILGRFRIAHGVRMWTGITIRKPDEIEAWRGALDVGALEHVRTLFLSPAHTKVEGYDWLLDSKLGKQLDTLELASLGWGLSLATWLARVERMPAIRRLRLRQTQNNPNMHGNGKLGIVALERASAAKRWGITVQVNSHDDAILANHLASCFGKLGKLDFDHSRLEYIGSERFAPSRMKVLHDIVSRALGDTELATERVAPIPS